jgi:ankyrin repeat protein
MRKDRSDRFFPTTELHQAVAQDDIERVRLLLEQGADINARAWLERTPLMDACSREASMLHKLRDNLSTSTSKSQEDRAPGIKDWPRIDPKQIFAMMDRKREYDDTLPQDDPALVRLLLEYGAKVDAVDQLGQTALMMAAGAGRVETARLLLEYGADPRAQDGEEKTSLMHAAEARRLEMVQLLLERGADIDYRTSRGFTLLMLAAEGGRVEIAQLLVARGQAVNTVSLNGYTALFRAAIKDFDAMIAFLKEAGATVGFLEAVALGDLELARSLPSPSSAERTREWGVTALFHAIRKNRAEMVRLLIERGLDPNATKRPPRVGRELPDLRGQSALFAAVMRDHPEIVRVLLDAGADPNGVAGSFSSPLGQAGRYGYTDIMNLLLERGADPNTTKERDGGTLNHAVMAGNLESARRLLAAGADPNGSVHGTTLLDFAIVRDDIDMVRLLLEHGATPQRDRGGTVKSLAMARDKPEILALIKGARGINLHELAKEGKTGGLLAQLDAGADINARGDFDQTLLLAALRGKQTATALTLIERGIDVEVVDGVGQSALMLAAAQGERELARLLLARGAKPLTTDRDGRTALFYAARSGRQEMVTLLLEAGDRIGPVEAALLGDIASLRQMLNGGAEVDTRDPGGMTPLMGASLRGHLEIISMLLIRHADINATDDEGRTALACAVYGHHPDAARLLLDNGADVNAAGEDLTFFHRTEASGHGHAELRERLRRKRRPSPLSLAALLKETAMAELLLERGADVNIPYGITGHDPLATAVMAGNPATVRLLLEHGADPATQDEFGQTPLSLARQIGRNNEVIALLEAHQG